MTDIEDNVKTSYIEEINTILNTISSNTLKSKVQSNNQDLEKEDTPKEAEINILIALYNKKQINDLLIQVNSLKLKFPNFYYLYFLKGLALKEQGEYENALVEIKKSLYLKPEFFEGLYEEGNINRTSKRFNEAISSYNRSLHIDPTNSKILNNIGICYLSMSDYKNSIQYFENAIKYDQSYILAYNNLGYVLAKLGETEKSYTNFKNATKHISNSPEIYKNLAAVDFEKGNIELAKLYFLKSLEITPNFIYSLRALISICIQSPQLVDIETRKKIKSLFLINKSFKDPIILTLLIIFYYSSGKRAKYDLMLSKLDEYKNLNEGKIVDKDENSLFPYALFLKSLKNYKWPKTTNNTESIFHIGDSHSLSFANQVFRINNKNFKVVPKLIIGTKAFHLSQPSENRYKVLFKQNMQNIPKKSKVFCSVGEIDCRIDEGILLHHQKTSKTLETIIKKTVYGYFNYVNEVNKITNHFLHFFSIPSPVCHKVRENKNYFQLLEIINRFNYHLKDLCLKHDYIFVDTFVITSNKNEAINKSYFCDNLHLSPSIIIEIENQINNN